MTFRTKLLAFFVATIAAAVTMVAWGVSVYTRRAFEEFDRQRTDALVAQFRREYAQRGDEIADRVQSITDAEATLRMAMDLNRPQADASQYYNDARGIAQSQQLDFVDIVADDGALISSSEWPARFGYKSDWVERRIPAPRGHARLGGFGNARGSDGSSGGQTPLLDRRTAPRSKFSRDACPPGWDAHAAVQKSRAGLCAVRADRPARPGEPVGAVLPDDCRSAKKPA